MHDSTKDQQKEQRAGAVWRTPPEVAERLKVPEGRIHELLDRRELEYVAIGGERRVSDEALAVFLERATQPPRAGRSRGRVRIGIAVTLAVLLGGVLLTGVLNAQSGGATSEVIPYHGYLEEDGQPVEARKYFTFCLTRTEAATGCIWNESHVLDVSGGRFGIDLGSVTSLDTVLAGAGDLWIGITVDGVNASNGPLGSPVTLTGKQLLGSVPFARRGSPGENFVVDGTLSSGSLSIQNAASVTQSLTVGNQITARQLNLSGRILFNNVQRSCIFATSCPTDWTDRGQGGFLIDIAGGNTCPFTTGPTYSGSLVWCYPRVCCS
jgi:excisionase family DNA binding protein